MIIKPGCIELNLQEFCHLYYSSMESYLPEDKRCITNVVLIVKENRKNKFICSDEAKRILKVHKTNLVNISSDTNFVAYFVSMFMLQTPHLYVISDVLHQYFRQAGFGFAFSDNHIEGAATSLFWKL